MSKVQKRRFTRHHYLKDARPGQLGVLKGGRSLFVVLRTAPGYKVLFTLRESGISYDEKPGIVPLQHMGSSLLLDKAKMMARAKAWLPAYDYREFARLMRTNDIEGLVGRSRL